MTNKEKLNLLEEMLDLEEGILNEAMQISEVENWDSMAVISLIALLDENFSKQISVIEIRSFKTVGDILKVMEENI